jgi:energy-coupling factor transporter ATP-binding protein EcfA2
MLSALWPFARKRQEPPGVMLWLNDKDYITKHQLYEGVLGIGATGSGKTTVLAHIQAALMASGAGMVILTASEGDWYQVALMAAGLGRYDDVIRVAPDASAQFDFLNWILANGSREEACQLMQDLVDFATKTETGKSHDPFWPLAAARKIRMAITLIHYAAGCCSVADVYEFINTMPRSYQELASPKFLLGFCAECLSTAAEKGSDHDADLAADYVLREFPGLAEKTGPSITAQTMNILEKFIHGPSRMLFASGKITVSPQDLEKRKIIVIDMPVLKWREPGRFGQMI